MHESEDARLTTYRQTQPKPPPGVTAADASNLSPREVAMILNFRAADEVTQARVRILLNGTPAPIETP
jgi:hypothetical protein